MVKVLAPVEPDYDTARTQSPAVRSHSHSHTHLRGAHNGGGRGQIRFDCAHEERRVRHGAVIHCHGGRIKILRALTHCERSRALSVSTLTVPSNATSVAMLTNGDRSLGDS